MYNFRRGLTLYDLLMVYAIKNFTYRGDICNLEDRSAAEPQPKNGRRKGKFNHEAREVRKI